MEALERAYLSVMSASRRDLTTGRALVQQMLREHPNRIRARMFAVHLAAHENLASCAPSLHTLLYDIIPAALDTKDHDTAAMAFVLATLFAMKINDTTVFEKLVPALDEFWSTYGNDVSIGRWRFACELNVAVHHLRNGYLDEAIERLTRILDLAIDPVHFCWLTKAHTQLAVAYARLGDTTKAREHAELAEKTGISSDKQDRLYAWGEIALAEGNLERAKILFHNAYRYAREQNDYYVMAYSQVMLSRIYREIGNIDAFWYAYDLAHELSRIHGIPHVFGVLADIAAGVPIIVQEEVEQA